MSDVGDLAHSLPARLSQIPVIIRGTEYSAGFDRSPPMASVQGKVSGRTSMGFHCCNSVPALTTVHGYRQLQSGQIQMTAEKMKYSLLPNQSQSFCSSHHPIRCPSAVISSPVSLSHFIILKKLRPKQKIRMEPCTGHSTNLAD